jgi:hypothetical protein
VVDLALWSFVIALTPGALGLAWKLISRVGDLIGLGLSRAFEDAQQWRPLRLNPSSGSISTAGRTPCPGT